VLTVDGVGEWATAIGGKAQGNRIELRREPRFPHSLGLLYSAFTGHLGFRVDSGEYKVMGLAPYDQPVHADLIRQQLLERRSDGSVRLRQEYFLYCHGLRVTIRRFTRLFGIPPRTPESPLLQ
jgi:carbamoyltransferase